jgi:hypothetical protein
MRVGKRHRLDLVVGNIDDRGAKPLMQTLDLGPHVDAKFRIEVGQGFVKQEKLWLAHQRAGNGNTLALAARKLAGAAISSATADLPRASPQPRVRQRNARHFKPKPMFRATVRFG